jgi:hypothetical protein
LYLVLRWCTGFRLHPILASGRPAKLAGDRDPIGVRELSRRRKSRSLSWNIVLHYRADALLERGFALQAAHDLW